MLLFLLIFLVIRNSDERLECGRILTSVHFALEGAGDWKAPWVVSMGIYEEGEYKVKCTGSLVTPDIIVTAAHCLRQFHGQWVVRAGVKDRSAKGAIEASLNRISIHPDYSSPLMYYDVGVALLNESLPLSDSISTLCLPDSPYDVTTMDNYGVTVQGWGLTDEGGAGQNLTEIEVTIRSRAECNYKYRRVDSYTKKKRIPKLVTEAMFCANNNINDDVGTCYGDSGGPVIRRHWDREEGADVFTLVGVVSGNPAGCIRNTLLFPDLYTFIGNSKVKQLMTKWAKISISSTHTLTLSK